jgi:D-sedoheptulose 7-phosphate isomerase
MHAFENYLSENLVLVNQTMADRRLQAAMDSAVTTIVVALKQGLPLLVCGNGGSASDAMHIAGELVGRFKIERPAYNVIALSANPSVLTAWSNDYAFDTVFSRQVEAYARPGGVVWGISTSGNSINVLEAFKKAKTLGMSTVGLSGAGGGKMAELSDILLDVCSADTPRIQELHICIYHFICAEVEKQLTAFS